MHHGGVRPGGPGVPAFAGTRAGSAPLAHALAHAIGENLQEALETVKH